LISGIPEPAIPRNRDRYSFCVIKGFMSRQKLILSIFAVTLVLAFAGCSVVNAITPQHKATITPTNTLTPTPTQTSTPTMTPTATEIPVYVVATVWTGELSAPILLYHEFRPNSVEESTATKTRLEDFGNQLQKLYDSGFSLVSLQSWMDGSFVVPEGRKPLVITLDDGIFANQLYINADGTPSTDSGLGLLWAFSKAHPDFGFSAAIFTVMGDKYYADVQIGDRFILGEGDAWKDKLGQTIAWGIENGVEPYNHTYTHVRLDLTGNADIVDQLRTNDYAIRNFLARVGRSDLVPKLGNMIALPFGIWPASQSGIEIIQNYKDPEGLKTQAIFEAYNLAEAVFTPSVFSPGFNRYNVQRLTASNAMVDLIVQNKDVFPVAQSCSLGPMREGEQGDMAVVQTLIGSAVTSGACPAGVYNVNGNVFVAGTDKVELFKESSAILKLPPTPTNTPTQQATLTTPPERTPTP